MLDRGVYQTLTIKGKGADFPFDGGTADITSRVCCSSFGWELPTTERTGDAGRGARPLYGADIAIANFENPAPDHPKYHTNGTVFSADPKLIKGLKNAGIDCVSLANNHIGDAGGAGHPPDDHEPQEVRHQRRGAGKNLAAARKPAIIEVARHQGRDPRLRHDRRATTRPGTTAGSAQLRPRPSRPTSPPPGRPAPMSSSSSRTGAPNTTPPRSPPAGARPAAIDAGADMVIGNHAHWAGAMEVYKGKPIWYALGNFVFDQAWSEPTMEGITLELTFRGTQLVQARMQPHIILDKAQPNFLDPAGDGRVVMGQVFDASKGLLPW